MGLTHVLYLDLQVDMNSVRPLFVGERLQLNCSVGIQSIEGMPAEARQAFVNFGDSLQLESTIYKTTVSVLPSK